MLQHTPLDLPELPYDFGALEPFIAAEIMELHYKKHHNAYVTNYNSAMEKYLDAQARGDLTGMLSLQGALRFNGGGHLNHSLFWLQLAPPKQGGGGEPKGALSQAIEQEFGSFSSFKEKLNKLSVGIQGSGWGWLGYCTNSQRLVLIACPNQDPPSLQGVTPILGLDVWEHAYYLPYKNNRAEYLTKIWEVVNWTGVEGNYQKAISNK